MPLDLFVVEAENRFALSKPLATAQNAINITESKTQGERNAHSHAVSRSLGLAQLQRC
jgi:hypothetical protein